MAYDCRVYAGFERHPKFIAIKEAYGADGVLGVVILWGYAAEYRPSGVLDGMSKAGICRACQIEAKQTEYVDFLTDCRILDYDAATDTYSLHNWSERNPNCAHRDEISAQKRANINSRWEREREKRARREAKKQAGKTGKKAADTGRIRTEADPKYPNPSQPSKDKDSLSPLSRESSEGERVRDAFAASLEQRQPGARLKRSDAWAERLQVAIDAGQTAEQLQAVWEWALADAFWRSRILSAKAFFDNLAAISIQCQEQEPVQTVVPLQNAERPLTAEEWQAMKKASVESTDGAVNKGDDAPP